MIQSPHLCIKLRYEGISFTALRAISEIPVATHLPGGELESDSRNHLNILTSTVVLALPGRVGTRAEIELSIRYRRPIAVHAFWHDAFPDLPRFDEVDAAIEFADRSMGRPRHED